MVIYLEDLLLFRIELSILDFFVFPYEVEYCPVKVTKNYEGIFIVALNLYIDFGRMVIFTMLILPIHDQARSSSISFFKSLTFHII